MADNREPKAGELWRLVKFERYHKTNHEYWQFHVFDLLWKFFWQSMSETVCTRDPLFLLPSLPVEKWFATKLASACYYLQTNQMKECQNMHSVQWLKNSCIFLHHVWRVCSVFEWMGLILNSSSNWFVFAILCQSGTHFITRKRNHMNDFDPDGGQLSPYGIMQ